MRASITGAGSPSRSSGLVRGGAVSLISAVMLTSANATGVDMFGCVGGWRGFNCAEHRALPATHTFARFRSRSVRVKKRKPPGVSGAG